MPEDSRGTEPLPSAAPRVRRASQSPWPIVVALVLLAGLAGGIVYTLVGRPSNDEPWQIEFPGVTWLDGRDAFTEEGSRYIQAKVRFDLEVVSAPDLAEFAAALLRHSSETYVYYHIMVLNAGNVHVLDLVAHRDGRYGVTETPAYYDQ